ncbi:hypothetical protein [Acinetobacter tandoii]|jgi:hypothetical protein|uniref:Uncharacterized protein n=2 Tax=Acinetobacter tandoii TaxID=202954 RepID=R9AQE7_9GAMM|nr:hypothetical protein [Acinetobacter tandoii]EOR04260.1 hypothetical protein I593_03337 [Acinetobacter tandoii DSM 14970 = CIP 107469]KAB1855847.1 hypothetical protein F4W09_08570 [Acinetobacter tandoii]
MHNFKAYLLPLLCSSLLFTGCSKNNEVDAPDPSQDRMMQELESSPVKEFPKTANDQHDITLLVDYDRRFSEMSDEMEDELIKMRDNGSLTDEFARSRKQDNIQSALTMLKALDLKTEQGRYIQGLMAQYWENQAKLLNQNSKASQDIPNSTPDNIKGLGEFLHAQEQLDHWEAQYEPAEKSKS